MSRLDPLKCALLAGILVSAALLGACTAKEVRDTAARTGLGAIRSGCHAAANCGVSCPEGSILNQATLACTPAPP